jgi:uncharacterized membrane protein YcjF (UPF0283 family)
MTMKDKLLIDIAVATPVFTMPWWLHVFEEWIQFGITIATLVIVISRVYIVYKEWKEK